MKKFITSIMLTTCILCLTGCSVGSEPEHKIIDPLPDKVIAEEPSEATTTSEKTTEATTERHVKTAEEIDQEYEEWKAEVIEARDKAIEEQSNEATTELTTEATTETYDPYAGLAVSNCHSVTLPKGVDYNTAIAEITKGTSAYPNTYPVIDNVDFNTSGVYSCAWVRLMDDGTYLPLDYATFTVTITDQYTGSAIIDAEYCKWSMSNHSLEIIEFAKQYVHYYGSGEISGELITDVIEPGEYTIKWTSTDGASFNQSVLVVE